MSFDFILKHLSRDMGIDLGTANSLVAVKGRGVVLQEPSVVAMHRDTNNILAVGENAKRMIGRTPGNIVAVRPMRDGVIADFDVTQAMMRHFISQAGKRSIIKPRVIVSVPSGVTEVEKRAVLDAILQAGGREAYLLEEPMAAAIGAGLPVNEPTGNMIVDIGGGTTEVAVISLGGIVISRSIRVGGDEMDEAIVSHVKRVYNLMIGERTAEEVKINLGSAYEPQDSEIKTFEVRGRDLITGLPKTINITSKEVREALAEPISSIVEAVKVTLERTPPELAADIMDRGIIMAGGGSMLSNFDLLLTRETGMPVYLAEDALTCVVKGTAKALEEIDVLKQSLASSRKTL